MENQPLCCKNAEIVVSNNGKISFGHGCIVHPKAKIIAEGCNIIFGEYNIIEENVIIRVKPKSRPELNIVEIPTMYIGCYNHFKVGCVVENSHIENFNIFDYFSKVQDDCFIESKCIITAGTTVPKRTHVKAGTIILDMQIIVTNTNFEEESFKKYISELFRILSVLLPKHNQLHDTGDKK